jgi:hypothetical protein
VACPFFQLAGLGTQAARKATSEQAIKVQMDKTYGSNSSLLALRDAEQDGELNHVEQPVESNQEKAKERSGHG